MEPNYILDFSNRVYKIALGFLGVLALAVLACLVYQLNNSPNNLPREISFTGEGKVYAKPDVALVSLGVHSDASKSQDAVDKNNEKMNAVIKSVKNAGVADEDIKTTLYSLNPIYDNQVEPMAYLYPRTNKVIGYSLDQQIEVKIRDLSKINNILDGATAVGATNVGNLQFVVDKPEVFQAQARAKAIAKAKEKMKEMVAQSGINVGKLVGVSDGYSYPQPMYGIGGGSMMKDSASVAPEIQSGQQEIVSNVTLTYRVK